MINETGNSMLDIVNGMLAEEGVAGIVERISVRTCTNTVDSPNTPGAPIVSAANMKITYIKTLDAALFCIKYLSLVLAAVSSRSTAMFPPDFNPEIINDIVLFIFCEWVLSAK